MGVEKVIFGEDEYRTSALSLAAPFGSGLGLTVGPRTRLCPPIITRSSDRPHALILHAERFRLVRLVNPSTSCSLPIRDGDGAER